MSLIAIISAIFAIVSAIPKAVSIVMEIIQLIRSLKGGSYVDKAALVHELHDKVAEARRTKDVSGLIEFHRKLGDMVAHGMRMDDPMSTLRQAESDVV
jgi:hypothetical protein